MPFNVFISYAHKDEAFRKQLSVELKKMDAKVRKVLNMLNIWYDKRLKVGEEWKKDIYEQMSKADIAIFLISPAFYSKPEGFIQQEEEPFLLKREQEKKTKIFSIFIEHTDEFYKDKKLSRLQGIELNQGVPNWDKLIQSLEEWIQNLENDKKTYFENIKEHYGKIRLLGHYEDTELEGIFTDLYVSDQQTALRHYNIEKLPKDHREIRAFDLDNEKRKNGLELVRDKKFQKLYILGKPGAGKTTFLKYILLQMVQGELGDKVPIFVSLKEWSDSKLGLKDFLIKQLENFGFKTTPDRYLEHLLTTNNILILLDGLDEVNEANRQRSTTINEIKGFINIYRQTSCLMTCRIAATDYSFSGFKYMELADFTNKEMNQYVGKWFKGNPVKKERFLSEFEKAEHEGLKELGRVPLLLSLLCLGFNENMGFPARRSDLYEEALDALLRKWDVFRDIYRDDIYRELSLKRKHQLFGRIAYDNFEKNQYFFEQPRLAQQIEKYLESILPEAKDLDGNTTLKAIECQHSIFVERAQRIYSFSHLTFQEYYTAKYIVDNKEKGTLEKVVQHCTEDHYREVLLLTASLLDDAKDFFEHFRRALDNILEDDPTLVEFLKWVEDKAKRVQTPYKIAAVRSFYGFLGLSLARDLDRDLALDLIRALDRDLVLAFARALAHALDLDLDHTLARDRDRDLAIDLALDFALDLDLALDLALALDLEVDLLLYFGNQFAIIFSEMERYFSILREKNQIKFLNYFEEVLKAVAQLGDPILEQKLKELKIPNKYNSQTAWVDFQKTLSKLIETYRHLKLDWDFNGKQLEKLETYFKANIFFIECLKLAAVDKAQRQTLLDSLLLPPTTEEEVVTSQ